IAIWSDAEREIERQAKQREKAVKERQAFLKDLATRATAAEADHENLSLLRKLTAERSALIETLAEDRRRSMAVDHMEAKAKSRAIRTRQTCLQFLADIRDGRADGATKVT